MTVTCPSGHESATTDYCDKCGSPIAGASPANPTEVLQPVADLEEVEEVEEVDTSTVTITAGEPCPACGAERSGGARYCEACGHDFAAEPQASATEAGWEAVIAADREQFDRFAVAGLTFPDGHPERQIVLTGAEVRIGDPAVSRRHAVLERGVDGGWTVRDLGSTNGTTINDAPSPVGTDNAVPLADGDTIRVGVWTRITLRSRTAF